MLKIDLKYGAHNNFTEIKKSTKLKTSFYTHRTLSKAIPYTKRVGLADNMLPCELILNKNSLIRSLASRSLRNY